MRLRIKRGRIVWLELEKETLIQSPASNKTIHIISRRLYPYFACGKVNESDSV